jgi:hypothetical protein
MTGEAGGYATALRRALGARSRAWARGRPHVQSYGGEPVIVYAPDERRHGNFFDPSYKAIFRRAEWMRRFDKIHAQGRHLPKAERRWRELDAAMSSDALLMNVFCAPGVVESLAVRGARSLAGRRVCLCAPGKRARRASIGRRWICAGATCWWRPS